MPCPAPELHVDYFGTDHNARHEDVRTWQEQMAWRGWAIGVDGIYGPQSELICKDFQECRHIDADGQVGPVTWEASWETAVNQGEIDVMHGGAAPEGELH